MSYEKSDIPSSTIQHPNAQHPTQAHPISPTQAHPISPTAETAPPYEGEKNTSYTQPIPQTQQAQQDEPVSPTSQPVQHGFGGRTGGGMGGGMTTPLTQIQQYAAPISCPVCGTRGLSVTECKSGGTTHLAALLFCCVACLGCIPYLATWFKDVEHRCAHCGAVLAVWHCSGRTEVVAHGNVGV